MAPHPPTTTKPYFDADGVEWDSRDDRDIIVAAGRYRDEFMRWFGYGALRGSPPSLAPFLADVPLRLRKQVTDAALANVAFDMAMESLLLRVGRGDRERGLAPLLKKKGE